MRFFILLFLSVPLSVLLSQQVKYENSVPALLQETEISRLTDFCVDDNSNYYLLDSELKKIWIYDSKSELKGEIPAKIGSLLLERPLAVELTSDNNIVILDGELKKVYTLDGKGSILNEFGNDLGVNGSFENPVGITTDPHDNIYVIDNALQQIIKFNSKGLFRGNESVINPIAIASDIENKIYVLTQNEDDDSYLIVSMPYDLRSRHEIRISNVIEPVDLTVNQFGEFYVVDREYRKVFHYGPAGNLIGEQIGIKSSSAGPGKFSEAAAVKNKFVNNEIDRLYVLDREFNYVQSFSIESRHERKKLYKQPPDLDIYLEKIISGREFKSFYSVIDSYFYVSADNSIYVEKEGKAVFTIRHSQINDVASITEAEENIYVADRSEGEIFAFSSTDGSFKFKFGREEELGSPAGITSDSRGNIYIADFNNSRIMIYSSSGEYKGKINTPGNSLLSNPSHLSIDEDDNLYIITTGDRYVFRYNINEMKLSQLRFPYRNIENINSPLVACEGNIVMTYNSFDGVVTLFRDGIELARFLSKGPEENQMENISGLFYDRVNSRIIAADNNSNTVKEFKLELASRQILKLIVNDFGNTELQWERGNDPGETYQLLRKRAHESEFMFFADVREPSYVVFENAEDIYDYAVKIVAAGGGEGKISNSVADKFSYCKFVRKRRPEVAIDMLNQIKYLNETIINNQIYAVYQDLLNRYKEQQKYDLALQTITRMKQLKPKNYVLYVEKAGIYESKYNFNEAAAELETAIDAFPDNINLYYHLLRVMQLNKNYDAVIEICNEGLSLFPGDENIIASLAEAYKNKQSYPEARRYYRMLAQQYGKEKYFLEEARILIAEGKFNEAFEIYDYIKTSGTATAALYSEIAEAYILQGDYDSALEQLNTGLQNDKENAHLHFLMGEVFSKQGRSVDALGSYERAVELDETEEDYFTALALEYLKAGDKVNATFNFEAAMLLDPNNLEVLLKLSDLYLEQEKYDYAYRLLSKAVSISPGSSEIKSAFQIAGEKREQANAEREPIEFNFIEVGELTPALLDYYSRNPFGSVTVFNTRNDAFTDIIIEISCPELFSAPALVNIPMLGPNEFVEKYYSLNIDSGLYENLPQNLQDLTISFAVKYSVNGQEKILSKDEKIILYW